MWAKASDQTEAVVEAEDGRDDSMKGQGLDSLENTSGWEEE